MKRVVAILIVLVFLCAAIPVFACGQHSGYGGAGFHGHHYGWVGGHHPAPPTPPNGGGGGGGKGDTRGTGGK